MYGLVSMCHLDECALFVVKVAFVDYITLNVPLVAVSNVPLQKNGSMRFGKVMIVFDFSFSSTVLSAPAVLHWR